ncbi:MAG: oligosaccharide flippase family protein [Spirochaetales bacterium]|nr:oligosaccharide flippase family protein [Spirochaetales bacterium]
MAKSTSKQVLLNFGVHLMSFGLQFVLGIFLTPFLIEAFGIESFGIIRLATNTTSYVAIIATSFSGAVNRFFIIELQKKEELNAIKIFNTALIVNLVFFLLCFPIMLLISLNSEKIFSIPDKDITASHFLFFTVQLGFFLGIFSVPFRAPAFAANRLDITNGIEIAKKLMRVVFTIIAATFFFQTIASLGAAFLLMDIITLTLVVTAGFKFAPYLKMGFKYFDKENAKALFTMSGWLLVDAVGTLLFLNSDMMLVNIFYGAEASGRFSALIVWITLIRNVGNIFASVISPLIYKAYSKGEEAELERLLIFGTRIISIVVGIIIGLVVGYSENLLSLWLGPEFGDSALLLSVMLLPWCFTLAMGPVYTVKTAYNYIKVPTFMLIGFGILNIGVILFCVKVLGLGVLSIPFCAAVIFTIRHFFEIGYLRHKKVLKTNKVILSVFSGAIIIPLVTLCGIYIQKLIVVANWPTFFLSGGVTGIISVLVIFFVFIRPKERKMILGYIKAVKK